MRDERVPGGEENPLIDFPTECQPGSGLIDSIRSHEFLSAPGAVAAVPGDSTDADDFTTRRSGSHTEEPTVVWLPLGYTHCPPAPMSTQGVPSQHLGTCPSARWQLQRQFARSAPLAPHQRPRALTHSSRSCSHAPTPTQQLPPALPAISGIAHAAPRFHITCESVSSPLAMT